MKGAGILCAAVAAAVVVYVATPASAGPSGALEDFIGYQVKESDKKAVNGALAKGCVVGLDDPIFDFNDGETTVENYEISKVKSLLMPGNKNDEGGVDLNGTHLLSFQIKCAKQSSLPVAGDPGKEKFPKCRKHVKHGGVEIELQNPTFGGGLSTIYVDTNKEKRVMIPANKDLNGPVPAVPGAGPPDHYKCYQVKETKAPPFGDLQDPAKGKLKKNIQVKVEDQLGEGAGHPTFGNARYYDLKKATELCVPVDKSLIDTVETDSKGATRTTTCAATPSTATDPGTGLLCFQAKAASKLIAQPWDGVDKGTKIDPKQAKHTKLTLKTGDPVFVGHQLTAPERIDTNKELEVCIPAVVNSSGTPL